MTCEKCGASLAIGDFPFCPHGASVAGKFADVTWAGGRTFENLAHTPQTFYSPTEYKAYLRNTNQQEFVRWAGPHDKHVPRWAMMDEYTLNAAKTLVERCGTRVTTTAPEPQMLESFSVRELRPEDTL